MAIVTRVEANVPTHPWYRSEYHRPLPGRCVTKGQFLCMHEDVPENRQLISNGAFIADISDWTALASSNTPPTLAWSPPAPPLSGRMRVTASVDGAGQRAESALGSGTTGKLYRVECDIVARSSPFIVRLSAIGTANYDETDGLGHLSVDYPAAGPNLRAQILMPISPGLGEWFEVDNVSMKEVA